MEGPQREVRRSRRIPSAGTTIRPGSYLGVYAPGVPQSYAGIGAFTAATGIRPGVVVYYSGWMEPFQVGSLTVAARHNAVPLVQIDPTGVSLAAIASGQYDTYLRSYASAVKAFGRPGDPSFGHEMNGDWYSWGYRHTSPTVFVAAWRHIVTVFRAAGAGNVTWLWTINVMQSAGTSISGPLVARQFLRDLGRNRRLLLQAILDIRFPVRADHQGRARADHRPDTHLRDSRPTRGTSRQRSLTCSLVSTLTGCWDSYGSTPTSQDWRLSGPRHSRRSARCREKRYAP